MCVHNLCTEPPRLGNSSSPACAEKQARVHGRRPSCAAAALPAQLRHCAPSGVLQRNGAGPGEVQTGGLSDLTSSTQVVTNVFANEK